VVAAATGIGGVAAWRATVARAGDGAVALAVLHDSAGAEVGTARFIDRRDGKVLVRMTVERGLTPGFHGFHVHEAGKCEAPFTSAKGHFHLVGQTHGHHAGDQPSLLVAADGTAQLEFVTDGYHVGDLLAGTGTALIIHRDADNFANIPSRYSSVSGPGPDAATLATGDSGPRVACGVITSADESGD